MRLENPKVIAAGGVLRGAIAHCHVVPRHVVPPRPQRVLDRANVGGRPACPLRELAALCLILRESESPGSGWWRDPNEAIPHVALTLANLLRSHIGAGSALSPQF